MSKYYTNSKGETIEVSDSHIEHAIAIKLELQKSSPSGRCSWAKHRKMMEEEGFDDSENSEQYRMFIKNCQFSNSKKEASTLNTTLDSISNEVGRIYEEKQLAQKERRELNKLKRDIVNGKTLLKAVEEKISSEGFAEEFKETYENVLELDKKKRFKGNNKAVLVISDWHIGATVDNVMEANSYNLAIAKDRMTTLVEKTLKYCEKFEVEEIVVANIGDMIEGLYMRSYNQPYESQLNLSEQINEVSRMLSSLLIILNYKVKVKYFGISGNHDRWFFEKNGIDGDNSMNVINELVKSYVRHFENIQVLDVDKSFNYEHFLSVDEFNFKFIHGDIGAKIPSIAEHSSMEGEFIDCLVMGHYHHYRAIEDNMNTMLITNGSMMGGNNFSRKMQKITMPSQTLIVLDNQIIPIKISL